MVQSVLHAAGIESLWWAIFWVTTIVTVIVFAVLALAVRRGVAATERRSDDRRLMRHVGIGAAATVIILIGLLVRSVVASRAIASERSEDALMIEVTAYQWWWAAEYQHPEPEQRV